MPRQRTRGGRGRFIVILVTLFFIISISTIVRLYTDLLWYQEVGYASFFWTRLGAQFLLAVLFGVAFFIFCLANLAIVTKTMPSYRLGLDPEDPLERYRSSFMPYLRWIAVGISAGLGALFALMVSPYWDRILLAMNAVPFGETDPLFRNDISFYVFRLPFYQFLYSWIFGVVGVVTILVAIAHYMTGGIRPQSPGERVTPQVKAHLSALIGLVALLRAWGYRLNQYELLYSTRGDITGASYTDVNAENPALGLLIVVSVIVAVLFLVNIRQRGWALPLAGLGLWLLISILARGAYPFFIQRFTVEPNQLNKERPYIRRNIDATRAAYGIQEIQRREYSATTGISREAVETNRATIENIRLWDPATLGTALRQLQEIRTYYSFNDVDVDRYRLNGELSQVMLSVRELASSNLDTQSWQNLHAVYTHGYGATVTPTNATTPQGHPELLVQDVPPTSTVPEFEFKEPGIYYGEGHLDYSVVNTDQEELDFATPEETEFTKYKGKGGVQTTGLLRRLAFAWRFRNINLAISGLINPDSRVIYYRGVRERLLQAAPFLSFDGDPYPVLTDGRIVWVVDAYTVSSMYPYSERGDFSSRTIRSSITGGMTGPSIEGRQNYIRNSVKATVDAYDGTVKLFVWDSKDPIIGAWQKIFPELFEDVETMPAQIREHVRYPEDLFRIQTDIYRRYHMILEREFYTREDLWIIPDDPSGLSGAGTGFGALSEIQPYYVLMRLPEEDKEEYVLILPMNPRGKGNMVSWIAAKSGPEDYGKLIDFRFPRGRLIHGVGQVNSRVQATPEIARTLTLLDQRGSKVIRGNLLVVPIADSILYVQPIFVQAEQGASAIPELSNVILATSDRVAMGTRLEDALGLLLEGGPITTTTPEGVPAAAGTTEELTKQALDHLRAAEEAAKRGDWTTYGREIQAARQALEQATASSRPAPSPSPRASPSP